MSLKIGLSNFHIVSLGDNAAGLRKKGGFGYEHFFVNELVCVVRSTGLNTIAQVKKLCPEFAIVEVGNGLEKQIPGIDIPVIISKLIDSYCLKRFAVHLPGTPDSLLKIGQTNLLPIFLGQDCKDILQGNGFSFDCVYVGEVIAVPYPDGSRKCGMVASCTEPYLSVDFGFGDRKLEVQIHTSEVYERVFKLGDRRYILEDRESGGLPRISVGRTTFSGKFLGEDASTMIRMNGFNESDFWVTEPVSLKVHGRRTLGIVAALQPSLLVETKDGRIAINSGDVADLCKLERNLYVADGGRAVPVVFDGHSRTVTIGRSVVRMLNVGQATEELHGVCNHKIPFRQGEAVSIKRLGTFEAAEVASMQPDNTLFLNVRGEELIGIQPSDQFEMIKTFRGNYVIDDRTLSTSPAGSPLACKQHLVRLPI